MAPVSIFAGFPPFGRGLPCFAARPASICWCGREGQDWQLLNIENRITPLAHPFLRPVRDLTPADQRRQRLARAVSTVLVAALHVLLFFALVIVFHPFDNPPRSIKETILYLSSPGLQNDAPPIHAITPEVPNASAPVITTAPITVPKPELDDNNTRPLTPGDILGAVGRELACSAGSWEHLTARERQVCGGVPWRGMRLPNGNLVMVPPANLPRLKAAQENDFTVNTGADRIQRDVQMGNNPANNGCPILQQRPCTHVTPNWDGPQ
jgi:hypothetical protein